MSSGFVAGTLVHTDKGLIPIQDLKVGDLVWSLNNENKKELQKIISVQSFQKNNIKRVAIIKTENYEDSYGDPIFIEFMSENQSLLNDKKEPIKSPNIDLIINLLNISDNHNLYYWNESVVWESHNNTKNEDKFGVVASREFGADDREIDIIVKFEKDNYLIDYDKWNSDYQILEKNTYNLPKNESKLIVDYFDSNILNKVKIKIETFNIQVENNHNFYVGNLGLLTNDSTIQGNNE